MEIRTTHEALRWASSFLLERNLEEPVAEWLLRHYLQINRSGLLMRLHEPIDAHHVARLKEDLMKHASGVPIQHLIGYEEFFGRRFKVNEHVLIPRPETEELIVLLCKRKRELFANEKVTLVDVGTGSGAISITMEKEENLRVIATDLSPSALAVAKENAKQLDANVAFFEGDLLEPLLDRKMKVDLFVSNPPYIPLTEIDQLAPHVRDHEPHLALFGGEDGLDLYRRIIKQLPFVMKHKGLIAFEVGIEQAKLVEEMLAHTFPKAKTEIVIDINGKERIVVAYGQMK